MKVAKVNPTTKTIELIELTGGEDNAGTLQDWYKEVECDLVTHFYLYHLGFENDLMFIMDDEGMFKEDLKPWVMPECHPVVGNALIYSVDKNTGKMLDFEDIEKLKTKIQFMP